jgi:cyclophilin family peptidyl-prolyl cis-trans isomerase
MQNLIWFVLIVGLLFFCINLIKGRAMSRTLFTPPPIDVEGEGDLLVKFETILGIMVAKLYENESPLTVSNFVYLATGQHTEGRPYYDGIIFHRVIPNFMIQGGCPQGVGVGGPGYVIKDEFDSDLKHDRPGLLSMANAGPNTGGSQFFVTEVATPWLDNRHALFGEVIEGMDVLKEIIAQPRDGRDRPRTDIVMNRVSIYRG